MVLYIYDVHLVYESNIQNIMLIKHKKSLSFNLMLS